MTSIRNKHRAYQLAQLAAAGTGELPAVSGADSGKVLRVNAGGNGFELAAAGTYETATHASATYATTIDADSTYALRVPDWVTGRTYPVGELVASGGVLYRCTTGHVAGVAFDATKFTAI